MSERIPFRFAPIPHDLLFDRDVPPQVIVLWAAIYRLADLGGGVAAIGQVDLGKELGWSDDTVARWAKKGANLGWIAVRRRGQGFPNEYRATIPDSAELRDQEPDETRGPPAELRDLSSISETSTRETRARSARSPSKRRTAFPLDWTPDETQREVATTAGMNATTRRAEFQKFKDHHLAHGKQMADWPAAWRTWCHGWRSFGAKQADASDDHDARVLAGYA